MIRSTYLIPIGAYVAVGDGGNVTPVIFLDQKDAYLPKKIRKYAGKYALFGGEVEPDEPPDEAIIREMGEEAPGWLTEARMPGSSSKVYGKPAVNGISSIAETILSTKRGEHEYTFSVVHVDGGPVSFRRLHRACREGSAIALPASTVLAMEDDQFVSEMVAKLLKALATQQLQIANGERDGLEWINLS